MTAAKTGWACGLYLCPHQPKCEFREPTDEQPAAQNLLLATQSGEYAAGYDAGVQAVWDKWVCSACGFNHDEDESASCEGADVISFADWYGRASDFLRSIREWRGLT